MDTSDEQRLLRALADKLPPSSELSELSMEQLDAALSEVVTARAKWMGVGGELIAEYRQRGLSWREITRRTGVRTTTARRWAEPFLKARQQ